MGAAAPPPRRAAARRRRIWPAIFGVVVAVVLIAALVAARISVNYYVLTPGDATPVSQFIEVPAADNHPLTGKILLTDVFVTQLNALNYLQYRFFDSDSEVVSGPELLGPTPDESQFLDPGVPPDGPGAVVRHRGGADPPRLHGHLHERRRARSTGSSPAPRPPRR